MSNQIARPTGLRVSWAVTGLSYGLVLGAGYWGLTAWWDARHALLWLIFALPVCITILLTLWRYLPDNHRHEESSLLPGLGAATRLTLARGLLLAFLAGFLPFPRPSGWLAWAPAACYSAAALADYFDGYLARITNHATLLGEKLDLDLDALGVLLAPLLGVLYGQLPVWYLLVSAARYLFALGIAVLKRQGRPVYNLTESARRRPLAGLQMGLNVVILLPLYTSPGTTLAATLFMAPFLTGFLRDWLVVSGVLDPQSNAYRRLSQLGEQIFFTWLPLALRIALVILLAIFLMHDITGSSGVIQTIIRVSQPARLTLFTILLIASGGLILFGILGRLSALILLLAAGLSVGGTALDLAQAALIGAATLVVLFGTGQFSAWQPEEVFLRHHAGAKQ